MKSGRGGFTLIELLVVIAIIGLLASIILASLTTARAKGRDAKRIADIRDIQNALQLYYSTCHQYPNVSPLSLLTSNGCQNGVTLGTFLPSLPKDPNSGTDYLYTAYGSGSPCVAASYHLGTVLEVGQTSGDDYGPKSGACTTGKYNGLSNNGASTNITATNGDFAPECAGSTSCSTAGSWVYDQYGS